MLTFVNALRALQFVVLGLPVLAGVVVIILGTLLSLPLWVRGLLTLVLPLVIAIVAIAKLTSSSASVTTAPVSSQGERHSQHLPYSEGTTVDSRERYFRDRTIRISDLAGDDDILRDKTFEDCTIIGPAVIAPLGVGLLKDCTFEAHPDTFLIPIHTPRGVVGPIGLEGCVFRRCTFRRIGIVCFHDHCDEYRRQIRMKE